MKAIRIHTYGGPEVLQYDDVALPDINPDEVLVRVHATGVNPVDWKIREGYFKLHQLPLILGWDLAGEIAEVGSEVTTFKKGDAVYAHPNMVRNGAYAEYIAVNANEVALKPESLDFTQASIVPLAALTAWQALIETANISFGQRVLIHAAAGGVGHFAVQLAKWKGAEVIGTASAHNQQFLLDCGVDQFVDYTTTRFENVIDKVDVVLDTIGGETETRTWPLVKEHGMLVSLIRPQRLEEEAKKHHANAQFIIVSPNAQQLTQLATLIDKGRITPHLQAVFPLTEAGKAHELSQAGHVRGKLALQVI